jgi:hypothetical protein
MSTRAWHSPRQTGRNELADMETVMSCQPVDCWLVLRLKQQVLPSVQHGVPWRLWTSFGPSSSDDDRMNMAGTHRFRRFSQDAATNYRGREKPNPQFHVALSIRLCPHLPQLHLCVPRLKFMSFQYFSQNSVEGRHESYLTTSSRFVLLFFFSYPQYETELLHIFHLSFFKIPVIGTVAFFFSGKVTK